MWRICLHLGKYLQITVAVAKAVAMLSVFELKRAHWCVQKGALTTAEVCEALGLGQLKNRSWHVQGAISIRGEGLYEGLDWYVVLNACTTCW